jgi:hypothetical protein
MNAFVRNGDILGDLFLPEPEKANGIGIVWCPGLPNTPITIHTDEDPVGQHI